MKTTTCWCSPSTRHAGTARRWRDLGPANQARGAPAGGGTARHVAHRRRAPADRWDHGAATQRFERVSGHEVHSEHEP